MHLKLEQPKPWSLPPNPIQSGKEVTIIASKLSCISVGTVGVVDSHQPDKGGYAVKVETHGTALFGGGSIKGEGIYFFEYNEVAAIPNPA